MERLTLEKMAKALKCVASQDREGDCYADHENFKHMEDDKYKRITCGTGENLRDFISGKDAVDCPYHQKNVWNLLRRRGIILVERCCRTSGRIKILQRSRRTGLACEIAV